MKRRESDGSVRLKRVLLQDSLNVPNGVLKVMKADVATTLSAYFDLEEGSVTLDVAVDENGTYDLKVTAKGYRAKSVKIL